MFGSTEAVVGLRGVLEMVFPKPQLWRGMLLLCVLGVPLVLGDWDQHRAWGGCPGPRAGLQNP